MRFLLFALAAGSVVLAAHSFPGHAGAPAPELARLNELLTHLVERTRPAVVQIREAGPGRMGGAGFLVDSTGVVVTVAHGLPSGARVDVDLADGRRLPGTVTARDERADLALVRVDGDGLPTLRFADSDRVRIGEFVLAVGHPFGLRQAVSLGIVGWMGAPPDGGPPGFDFIHPDASVNPGNSGGPLVDLRGEVIGVTSWAARNGSMGIAVPANLVQLVLPHLLADGRVAWSWLGVQITDARPQDLRWLGSRDTRGALIGSVVPGAPAERAGLRAGDVVMEAGGRPIDRARDLQRFIAGTPAGSVVRIGVVRGGEQVEVEVTLAPYPNPAGHGDHSDAAGL